MVAGKMHGFRDYGLWGLRVPSLIGPIEVFCIATSTYILSTNPMCALWGRLLVRTA